MTLTPEKTFSIVATAGIAICLASCLFETEILLVIIFIAAALFLFLALTQSSSNKKCATNNSTSPISPEFTKKIFDAPELPPTPSPSTANKPINALPPPSQQLPAIGYTNNAVVPYGKNSAVVPTGSNVVNSLTSYNNTNNSISNYKPLQTSMPMMYTQQPSTPMGYYTSNSNMIRRNNDFDDDMEFGCCCRRGGCCCCCEDEEEYYSYRNRNDNRPYISDTVIEVLEKPKPQQQKINHTEPKKITVDNTKYLNFNSTDTHTSNTRRLPNLLN